jgi:hypothetical protein
MSIKKQAPVALSDTEKRTIRKTDNVKTSPSRQAWKKSALILQGKLPASPTAKHSIREGITKRAAVFFPFRSLLS